MTVESTAERGARGSRELREWVALVANFATGAAAVSAVWVSVATARVQHDMDRSRDLHDEKKLLIEEYRFHFARVVDPGNGRVDPDFTIATKAAVRLEIDYELPDYRRALFSLATLPAVELATGGNPEFRLQVDETGSAASARREEGWFAVVASVPIEGGLERAEAAARDARDRLRSHPRLAGVPVEVWQTVTSGQYAVTLGGLVDRATALERAATGRQAGLARDAFAQVNRAWTRKISCSGSACQPVG